MAHRPHPSLARISRWAALGGLLVTIPAFYAELISRDPPSWAGLIYLLAAAALAGEVWFNRRWLPRVRLFMALGLVVGLVISAVLPASSVSQGALAWRLAVAFLTLMAMVLELRRWITRGGVIYLMLVALAVLLLCGVGYWWLEPSTPTLADGIWLAFTTAATVGFGDVVPSTPASRIFSAFVVLLGYGVLSLATAAIATSWIETEERRIEREILRDLHQRLGSLHEEIAALRRELHGRSPPPSG